MIRQKCHRSFSAFCRQNTRQVCLNLLPHIFFHWSEGKKKLIAILLTISIFIADHSRVLLTKAEPYDIAFGNFTANQVSIQIPKKGFYEVSTIATMKITPNITTATHAVFRESGNTTLIIMKRSYSVHADVMAFQQSVLKDTFLLNHGDKLSVFVSRVYGVYEKTTPISIRLIGYGSWAQLQSELLGPFHKRNFFFNLFPNGPRFSDCIIRFHYVIIQIEVDF